MTEYTNVMNSHKDIKNKSKDSEDRFQYIQNGIDQENSENQTHADVTLNDDNMFYVSPSSSKTKSVQMNEEELENHYRKELSKTFDVNRNMISSNMVNYFDPNIIKRKPDQENNPYFRGNNMKPERSVENILHAQLENRKCNIENNTGNNRFVFKSNDMEQNTNVTKDEVIKEIESNPNIKEMINHFMWNCNNDLKKENINKNSIESPYINENQVNHHLNENPMGIPSNILLQKRTDEQNMISNSEVSYSRQNQNTLDKIIMENLRNSKITAQLEPMQEMHEIAQMVELLKNEEFRKMAYLLFNKTNENIVDNKSFLPQKNIVNTPTTNNINNTTAGAGTATATITAAVTDREKMLQQFLNTQLPNYNSLLIDNEIYSQSKNIGGLNSYDGSIDHQLSKNQSFINSLQEKQQEVPVASQDRKTYIHQPVKNQENDLHYDKRTHSNDSSKNKESLQNMLEHKNQQTHNWNDSIMWNFQENGNTPLRDVNRNFENNNFEQKETLKQFYDRLEKNEDGNLKDPNKFHLPYQQESERRGNEFVNKMERDIQDYFLKNPLQYLVTPIQEKNESNLYTAATDNTTTNTPNNNSNNSNNNSNSNNSNTYHQAIEKNANGNLNKCDLNRNPSLDMMLNEIRQRENSNNITNELYNFIKWKYENGLDKELLSKNSKEQTTINRTIEPNTNIPYVNHNDIKNQEPYENTFTNLTNMNDKKKEKELSDYMEFKKREIVQFLNCHKGALERENLLNYFENRNDELIKNINTNYNSVNQEYATNEVSNNPSKKKRGRRRKSEKTAEENETDKSVNQQQLNTTNMFHRKETNIENTQRIPIFETYNEYMIKNSSNMMKEPFTWRGPMQPEGNNNNNNMRRINENQLESMKNENYLECGKMPNNTIDNTNRIINFPMDAPVNPLQRIQNFPYNEMMLKEIEAESNRVNNYQPKITQNINGMNLPLSMNNMSWGYPLSLIQNQREILRFLSQQESNVQHRSYEIQNTEADPKTDELAKLENKKTNQTHRNTHEPTRKRKSKKEEMEEEEEEEEEEYEPSEEEEEDSDNDEEEYVPYRSHIKKRRRKRRRSTNTTSSNNNNNNSSNNSSIFMRKSCDNWNLYKTDDKKGKREVENNSKKEINDLNDTEDKVEYTKEQIEKEMAYYRSYTSINDVTPEILNNETFPFIFYDIGMRNLIIYFKEPFEEGFKHKCFSAQRFGHATAKKIAMRFLRSLGANVDYMENNNVFSFEREKKTNLYHIRRSKLGMEKDDNTNITYTYDKTKRSVVITWVNKYNGACIKKFSTQRFGFEVALTLSIDFYRNLGGEKDESDLRHYAHSVHSACKMKSVGGSRQQSQTKGKKEISQHINNTPHNEFIQKDFSRGSFFQHSKSVENMSMDRYSLAKTNSLMESNDRNVLDAIQWNVQNLKKNCQIQNIQKAEQYSLKKYSNLFFVPSNYAGILEQTLNNFKDQFQSFSIKLHRIYQFGFFLNRTFCFLYLRYLEPAVLMFYYENSRNNLEMYSMIRNKDKKDFNRTSENLIGYDKFAVLMNNFKNVDNYVDAAFDNSTFSKNSFGYFISKFEFYREKGILLKGYYSDDDTNYYHSVFLQNENSYDHTMVNIMKNDSFDQHQTGMYNMNGEKMKNKRGRKKKYNDNNGYSQHQRIYENNSFGENQELSMRKNSYYIEEKDQEQDQDQNQDYMKNRTKEFPSELIQNVMNPLSWNRNFYNEEKKDIQRIRSNWVSKQNFQMSEKKKRGRKKGSKNKSTLWKRGIIEINQERMNEQINLSNENNINTKEYNEMNEFNICNKYGNIDTTEFDFYENEDPYEELHKKFLSTPKNVKDLILKGNKYVVSYKFMGKSQARTFHIGPYGDIATQKKSFEFLHSLKSIFNINGMILYGETDSDMAFDVTQSVIEEYGNSLKNHEMNQKNGLNGSMNSETNFFTNGNSTDGIIDVIPRRRRGRPRKSEPNSKQSNDEFIKNENMQTMKLKPTMFDIYQTIEKFHMNLIQGNDKNSIIESMDDSSYRNTDPEKESYDYKQKETDTKIMEENENKEHILIQKEQEKHNDFFHLENSSQNFDLTQMIHTSESTAHTGEEKGNSTDEINILSFTKQIQNNILEWNNKNMFNNENIPYVNLLEIKNNQIINNNKRESFDKEVENQRIQKSFLTLRKEKKIFPNVKRIYWLYELYLKVVSDNALSNMELPHKNIYYTDAGKEHEEYIIISKRYTTNNSNVENKSHKIENKIDTIYETTENEKDKINEWINAYEKNNNTEEEDEEEELGYASDNSSTGEGDIAVGKKLYKSNFLKNDLTGLVKYRTYKGILKIPRVSIHKLARKKGYTKLACILYKENGDFISCFLQKPIKKESTENSLKQTNHTNEMMDDSINNEKYISGYIENTYDSPLHEIRKDNQTYFLRKKQNYGILDIHLY